MAAQFEIHEQPLSISEISSFERSAGAIACWLGGADGHDFDGFPRALEFVDAEVGHADRTNLAFPLRFGERPNGIFERNIVIDGMELVELDPLELQAPQAPLARLPQMRRPHYSFLRG